MSNGVAYLWAQEMMDGRSVWRLQGKLVIKDTSPPRTKPVAPWSGCAQFQKGEKQKMLEDGLPRCIGDLIGFRAGESRGQSLIIGIFRVIMLHMIASAFAKFLHTCNYALDLSTRMSAHWPEGHSIKIWSGRVFNNFLDIVSSPV